MRCSDDGYSFYQCSNWGWQYMGSVAQGTRCVDGVIVADGGSAASPTSASSSSSSAEPTATTSPSDSCYANGALLCGADGSTFYQCWGGSYVYMGPVAPGTKCVDGRIGYARLTRRGAGRRRLEAL